MSDQVSDQVSDRMSESGLRLLVERRDDGKIALLSPTPAIYRGGLKKGALIGGGMRAGELIVLGRGRAAIVPEGISGRVVELIDAAAAEPACAYGERLIVIDPSILGEESASDEREGAAEEGLVLRAKMGGRFYKKPAPDKPDFVSEGDEISLGATLGLLEVMKTFHRIQFRDEARPERARVVACLVEDGADIERDQPLFRFEAL